MTLKFQIIYGHHSSDQITKTHILTKELFFGINWQHTKKTLTYMVVQKSEFTASPKNRFTDKFTDVPARCCTISN